MARVTIREDFSLVVADPRLDEIDDLDREIEELRSQRRGESDFVYQRRGQTYWADPVAWAHDCIDWPEGKRLAPYQEETLMALVEQKRASFRSLHGAGKTMLAAVAVHWFVNTRDAAGADWKCPTTASAWRQLEDYLWPEIRKWSRMLRWDVIGRQPYVLGRELLKLHLTLATGSAFALASDDPASMEGAHADELLYVFDESKAIRDATFDAAEGAFSTAGLAAGTNAMALAISTPGEPVGRFYDIHARKPGLEDWWVRHVRLDEAIAAERVTAEWAAQRRALWGENSAVYKNRVLGEFATASEDGVIPLAWVEQANDRWRAIYERDGKVVGRPVNPSEGTWRVLEPGAKLHTIGADIARGGEDRTVFALRQGNTVAELRRLPFTDDTMLPANLLSGIQEGHGMPTAIIDVIGVGAGVFDRVRELKLPCRPFAASEGTKRHDQTGEFGFCLTGDAQVWPIGQLRTVYRSRFDCPFYRVKLASGNDFTATPNHHVLAAVAGTLPRWVAIHALRPGDRLVRPLLGQGTGSGDPHVEKVPPKISEVYSAACQVGGAERVPGRRVHFYGDRPVGEVDVVSVDGPLLALDEPGWEHVAQLPLDRLLTAEGQVPGQGAAAGGLRVERNPRGCVDRLGPVAGQSVRRSSVDLLTRPQTIGLRDIAQGYPLLGEDPLDRPLSGPVRRRQSGHRLSLPIAGGDGRPVEGPTASPQSDRLLLRPQRHTVFGQHPSEYAAVDPEGEADASLRLTGLVSTDQVIGIEMVDPGWHEDSFVYTLETSTGSYCTASAIHKNSNKRAWAWWNLREMLDPNNECDVALVPDDRLTGDLLAPKWKLMAGAKIQVESKDDIRKRIGRSTDDGDAVVQAYTESGGSWADLYREPEPPEPGVPQPKLKKSRSGGWGDAYRPPDKPGEVSSVDAAAAVLRGDQPEIPKSGYFAGSAIGLPAQPEPSKVDRRALAKPCQCGDSRASHKGDGPCSGPDCTCPGFTPRT